MKCVPGTRKERKHSEISKVIYKGDKYSCVLENVKYAVSIYSYAVSISYYLSFIVGPVVQFLCIIYLKNTFQIYVFCIFYFLGFILHLIIL